MLRGGKHGHIHSNFRNDADCGKGLDTRHRHNKAQLRKIFLSSRQNQRFQICFAQFQASHVRTDDAELFSLLGTQLSVHGDANTCSLVAFMPLVQKPETFVIFSDGFSKSRVVIAEAAFPKTSENTSSRLKLETVRKR